MAQVLIRNLDESVVAALKARAAAKGHSLEQELRLLLEAAARPDRTQAREVARAIRGQEHPPIQADLEELLREDRRR